MAAASPLLLEGQPLLELVLQREAYDQVAYYDGEERDVEVGGEVEEVVDVQDFLNSHK
jgi:hypothetical protein